MRATSLLNEQVCVQGDLISTIGESAAVGASGAVLWGASADYDDQVTSHVVTTDLHWTAERSDSVAVVRPNISYKSFLIGDNRSCSEGIQTAGRASFQSEDMYVTVGNLTAGTEVSVINVRWV